MMNKIIVYLLLLSQLIMGIPLNGIDGGEEIELPTLQEEQQQASKEQEQQTEEFKQQAGRQSFEGNQPPKGQGKSAPVLSPKSTAKAQPVDISTVRTNIESLKGDILQETNPTAL